ncbi:MAG: FAD-binding oxidoreductase [Opitutales bacterium]
MPLITAFSFASVFAELIGLFTTRIPKRRCAGKADRSYDPSPGERYLHLWGYRDTQFEFCGPQTVRVTGARYPLAGSPLPHFVPFVEEVLGLQLKPEDLLESAPEPVLPSAKVNKAFLSDLNERFSSAQLATGDEERLVHSHGQLSVEEIYRILGGAAPERVVDFVVFPTKEAEVLDLVCLAGRHDVVLVPYGGGTNVSGALLCPREEERMIVSVDMQRMNRIVEIDAENNWAVVEAGITGKDLEAQLEKAGLTCGHIPDSIEFSTLGGWIATNASGMKKNRYGNIEDIVLEAVLVTPRGEVESVPVNPRSSTGIRPRNFLFGSEGSLGIITRAVIQVHSLPEVRKYASFVFPNFEAGTGFLKDVQEYGARPASIRLTNNTEFRLGQAISPSHARWKAFTAGLKKRYVLGFKGFNPKKMVACTAVMEGTVSEVEQQERTLSRLLRAHGGLSGGEEGGKRGYRVTFAIAYIRDFLNKLGIIGETFETSAPWSRIGAITGAVERELRALCKASGVAGMPYLSYRISQSYQTGVCIYFTMGFSGRELDHPEETYKKIEHRLREVILEQGGSLSHHHGVGKVRRDFVSRVHSEASVEALQALKEALDPKNVFASRNNVFGLKPAPTRPAAVNRENGEEKS